MLNIDFAISGGIIKAIQRPVIGNLKKLLPPPPPESVTGRGRGSYVGGRVCLALGHHRIGWEHQRTGSTFVDFSNAVL